MPMYSYRREDGTTFEIRQKFLDEPLLVDPETGQKVTRIVQAAGVIFKGSGFYVTDNKGAAKSAAPAASSTGDKGSDAASGSASKSSSLESSNGSSSNASSNGSSSNGSSSAASA